MSVGPADPFATQAPGTQSVMAAPPQQSPEAQVIQPGEGPFSSGGFNPPPGASTVDDATLQRAGLHADMAMRDRAMNSIEFRPGYTPQQANEITQIAAQKQHVWSMLSQGVIRDADARVALKQLDDRQKLMQRPTLIPHQKPTPMSQEYQDRVFTDQQGNQFIRQPGGQWDVRPPSPHSPMAQHSQQLHEAAMEQAGAQHELQKQYLDHHHDAQMGNAESQGDQQQQQTDLALGQNEIAQSGMDIQHARIKMQAEIAKNNAKAQQDRQKFAADQEKQTRTAAEHQQAQELKERDAYRERYRKTYTEEESKFVKTAQAEAKAKYQAGESDAAPKPVKPDPAEIKRRALARMADEDSVEEQKFGPRKPAGGPQPTEAGGSAPPELSGQVPPDRQAAFPQAAPVMPHYQHPDLRPEAPPEVHLAAKAMQDIVNQKGRDPSKWTQKEREYYGALQRSVREHRSE